MFQSNAKYTSNLKNLIVEYDLSQVELKSTREIWEKRSNKMQG